MGIIFSSFFSSERGREGLVQGEDELWEMNGTGKWLCPVHTPVLSQLQAQLAVWKAVGMGSPPALPRQRENPSLVGVWPHRKSLR